MPADAQPAQVVFITGAASGIGRATAERFAARGARLLLTDVKRDAGQALADRAAERQYAAGAHQCRPDHVAHHVVGVGEGFDTELPRGDRGKEGADDLSGMLNSALYYMAIFGGVVTFLMIALMFSILRIENHLKRRN